MQGSSNTASVRTIVLSAVGKPASGVTVDAIPPCLKLRLMLLCVVFDTTVSDDGHWTLRNGLTFRVPSVAYLRLVDGATSPSYEPYLSNEL